ncbi:nitrilase family protein [Natrinema versiforme]|uniref:Nitrilase n=1 Tax=Natrinema versiforme TaxID=88724 RepID=A0A4P8WMP7_9EURY|nr:nitrilase family protein [Natrinema versiforme]QCS44859.1 nitrilase [Natrinema versiforme]
MNSPTATRVAVAQTIPEFGAVEPNRDRTVDIVRENASADLVVLPELSTTGYVFDSIEEVAALAEPRDGPTGRAWETVAAETDTWIVGGFAEADGGAFYNSALIVSPDGIEGVYRKVHRWNEEKRWFDPGDDAPVFETPFGRLGVQICNDLWFPEQTITQARAGADLIAVPTNWVPEPAGEGAAVNAERQAGWTMGVHQTIAHANANRVFIACADRAGTERGTSFEGQSVVVDPIGVPLAGPAPRTGEHTVLADCDLPRARSKRLTGRDDVLADRRPDVYDLGYSSSGGA